LEPLLAYNREAGFDTSTNETVSFELTMDNQDDENTQVFSIRKRQIGM
jgi:hypothetical protein